jgi:hypothetical protein
MNTKKLSFTILVIFFSLNIYTQDTKKGDIFSTIFWNYNTDLSSEASKKNSFEVKRVYLGYKFKIDDKISAKVTFDIGKNSAGSDYTAFLKTAQIDWSLKDNFKISFGMIGNKQFKYQESIWGYRYLYKTFQDENKFGSSADLGVNGEIKVSKNLKMNLFMLNGEGYKNIQDDDGYMKIGGNLIYEISNGLSLKLYYDSEPGNDEFNVTNVGYFIGYDKNKTRVGFEYNKINNAKSYNSPSLDNNLSGFSGYISQNFSENSSVFFRYDSLESNIVSGSSEPWNSGKDGKLMILGYEHVVTKGFKLNLNYRNYNYTDNSINNKSMVFINAEIKI